jgi:hypothetical protein
MWDIETRVGYSRLGRYNKQFRIYITELYNFLEEKKQRKRTRSGKLEFSTQRLETQHHPIKMIQVENYYIFQICLFYHIILLDSMKHEFKFQIRT